jgi:uncharacterized membrane protein YcaP (DUF421 family)
MELHRIAVRAVFAYVVLLGLLRASGKRTVARGTPFDFVLALILGDMIDDLLWAEVPAARFAVGVATLALAHSLVAMADARSERFSRWMAGAPARVLERGRPCPDALRAERMSERELERLLRSRDVPRERWGDVREATVEVSGHGAVTPEPWAEPLRKRDVRTTEPQRTQESGGK